MAMSLAAATLGAAAIGAGTSLYGASQANKGNKRAIAEQRRQYDETKGMLSPYVDAGTGALDTYQTALGLKGLDAQKAYHDNFQTDPGWTAAQEAGLQAVDDRYRLSGSGGGNLRAALYDYGQRNMLSAYNTRLQQLGGLVDTGRSAIGTLAGAGQSMASGIGGLLSNIGTTAGNAAISAGNAVSGALNNYALGSMFNQGQQAGRGGAGGWDTFTVNYAKI